MCQKILTGCQDPLRESAQCRLKEGFMKRLFVILLGSVCALFYRVFPVDAAIYDNACNKKIQECLSKGQAPHYQGTGTCGTSGSSGTTECCNMIITCETTGTTYTTDNGKSCNVCKNECATLTGTAKDHCELYYQTVFKNDLQPLSEYLCSSYKCCPSGGCSSSGGGSGSTTTCNQGQYLSGGQCVSCPEHKTTIGSGKTSSTDCVCDMGYGNASSGTGADVQCVVCNPGTYKSTAGNTPCTACPGATGSTPSCITGATLVTQCYISSGDDSLGSYLYKPDCYYTSGA